MDPVKLPIFNADNVQLGTIEITNEELCDQLKRDRRFLMAGLYHFRRMETRPFLFKDSKQLNGIQIAACGSGTAIPQVQEVVSATE